MQFHRDQERLKERDGNGRLWGSGGDGVPKSVDAERLDGGPGVGRVFCRKRSGESPLPGEGGGRLP